MNCFQNDIYESMKRGDDKQWDRKYPGAIARVHFINSLYQAYLNRDCVGLSFDLSCEFFSRNRRNDRKEASTAVGQSIVQLTLLYYISCKYGGFRVQLHDKFYNVPHISPADLDGFLAAGRLQEYFTFLPTFTSWENVNIKNLMLEFTTVYV